MTLGGRTGGGMDDGATEGASGGGPIGGEYGIGWVAVTAGRSTTGGGDAYVAAGVGDGNCVCAIIGRGAVEMGGAHGAPPGTPGGNLTPFWYGAHAIASRP